METLVGTSECRSDVNLLLWELLLLGATAADWHGLLSFITDTSKLPAFWEMSRVGLFPGGTGTTSVKTLLLVLFPSENLGMLSRSVSNALRPLRCGGVGGASRASLMHRSSPFVACVARLVRMYLALHWSASAAVCV